MPRARFLSAERPQSVSFRPAVLRPHATAGTTPSTGCFHTISKRSPLSSLGCSVPAAGAPRAVGWRELACPPLLTRAMPQAIMPPVMTRKEMVEARAVFTAFDTDGNGSITRAELRA